MQQTADKFSYHQVSMVERSHAKAPFFYFYFFNELVETKTERDHGKTLVVSVSAEMHGQEVAAFG